MFFRSICVQEFLHGIAKLLRYGTLAATNRRRNPKSDVHGNLKSYDVYRQQYGGGMNEKCAYELI